MKLCINYKEAFPMKLCINYKEASPHEIMYKL